MHKATFQNRAKRDEYARELRSRGLNVRKRSVKNQSLSPEYVVDYEGTPMKNMFGGTERQFFPTLYIVEAS